MGGLETGLETAVGARCAGHWKKTELYIILGALRGRRKDKKTRNLVNLGQLVGADQAGGLEYALLVAELGPCRQVTAAP